jgi:hypothetical protein
LAGLGVKGSQVQILSSRRSYQQVGGFLPIPEGPAFAVAGTLIATDSAGQLIIKLVEGCALGVEVDMSVDVHGHLDGAVANDLHDHTWVDA